MSTSMNARVTKAAGLYTVELTLSVNSNRWTSQHRSAADTAEFLTKVTAEARQRGTTVTIDNATGEQLG